MANSLLQKLKIKEGDALRTINAPGNFEEELSSLPADVTIGEALKNYNQVHWFVESRAQLEKEIDEFLSLVKPGVVCWIYYPKGTSKIKTDLTRDKGWDALLAHKELNRLTLISFNDTWSAFSCRLKTEADKRKENKSAERPIFEYIDTAKKTVRLPDDLMNVLKKNKAQETIFNGLSYSNKKEYVEWIITARREETRAQRVTDTLEKLSKGWKNPANR